MEWRDFAGCNGVDDDLFFDTSREAEAKEFCDPCPVKGFCELDARNYHSVGVWGGTSWRDRTSRNGAHNPIQIVWR